MSKSAKTKAIQGFKMLNYALNDLLIRIDPQTLVFTNGTYYGNLYT